MKRLAILFVLASCGPKPSAPVTTTPEPTPTEPTPETPTPTPAPEPTPPPGNDVTFVIEDSFDISGSGPVALGRIRGHVEVGDKLMIDGSDPPIVVDVRAVELQRDRSGNPTPDTPVGLLLRLPPGSDRATVLVRGATLVRAR